MAKAYTTAIKRKLKGEPLSISKYIMVIEKWEPIEGIAPNPKVSYAHWLINTKDPNRVYSEDEITKEFEKLLNIKIIKIDLKPWTGITVEEH